MYDFDVDTLISRAERGEFGSPGSDEFGGPGGRFTPEEVATILHRCAGGGAVPRNALLEAAGHLSRLPGYPAYGRPFPGFGGPVGPGKGSVCVPIGIGTVVGAQAAAMAALTRANPRGPMRIKRVLIQAVPWTMVPARSAMVANNQVRGTVTAMTVAGFPLIDGIMGTDTFEATNDSPVEFNQVWEPGIPFTINITAQVSGPATQGFTVAVLCAAM